MTNTYKRPTGSPEVLAPETAPKVCAGCERRPAEPGRAFCSWECTLSTLAIHSLRNWVRGKLRR